MLTTSPGPRSPSPSPRQRGDQHVAFSEHVLPHDGASVEVMVQRTCWAARSAEDVVVDAEFDWHVGEALRVLPEKHRAVVALVDLCGLDCRAAADALGVPRGTVLSRLHRARSKIRDTLACGAVMEVT